MNFSKDKNINKNGTAQDGSKNKQFSKNGFHGLLQLLLLNIDSG